MALGPISPGFESTLRLAKALELWAFRVSVLCKSIQSKAAAMSSLVVGLVLAFAYCWQMALVMLGAIPIMVMANAIQMLVLLGASKMLGRGKRGS